MSRLLAIALLPTALAVLSGCQLWSVGATASDEQTLLRAIQAPPDAVPLDIYWVRFPWGDTAMNDQLWLSIQEDRIPVEIRQRLTANGLRAGVLGGSPPTELARRLSGDSTTSRGAEGNLAIPLIDSPPVERRLVHIKPGQVKQENATELLDEATVLINRNDGLGGRTYKQVQGLYSIVAAPVGTSRVRVELTPEIVHGEPRMKWHQSQPGVMVQSVGREREVLDDLNLFTELAAGEMLVVMGRVDSRGQLGGLFHTSQDGSEREQKLLLIRLSQKRPTDLTPTDPGELLRTAVESL